MDNPRVNSRVYAVVEMFENAEMSLDSSWREHVSEIEYFLYRIYRNINNIPQIKLETYIAEFLIENKLMEG